MSELLDKQVYVLNEFRIEIPGFTRRSHKPTKACDENKRKNKEKNDSHVKIFLITERLLLKLDVTDVDELQVNNSSCTNGTICLVNG